jgi:hypothetical protein
MVDAIGQLVLWFINVVEQFAAPIAIAVGGYWLWVLWRRLGDSSDPSMRKQTQSGIGSMSMLVSGAYVSVMLAAAIAVTLWLAGWLSPLVAGVLLTGVIAHAALEKREDMGGSPLLGGEMDDD